MLVNCLNKDHFNQRFYNQILPGDGIEKTTEAFGQPSLEYDLCVDNNKSLGQQETNCKLLIYTIEPYLLIFEFYLMDGAYKLKYKQKHKITHIISKITNSNNLVKKSIS